jgi:hypothetical protein
MMAMAAVYALRILSSEDNINSGGIFIIDGRLFYLNWQNRYQSFHILIAVVVPQQRPEKTV